MVDKQLTPSALVNHNESPVDPLVNKESYGHPHFQQFTSNNVKYCLQLLALGYNAANKWGEECKHVHNNSMAPNGKSLQETLEHQKNMNEW